MPVNRSDAKRVWQHIHDLKRQIHELRTQMHPPDPALALQAEVEWFCSVAEEWAGLVPLFVSDYHIPTIEQMDEAMGLTSGGAQ